MDVTWRQILETGNVIKIRVNTEFRGSFLVSSIRRTVNDRVTGYHVSCIGMQQWLMRQSIFFDVGGEAHYLKKTKKKESPFLKKFKEYVTPDALKETINPTDAIKYIINKLLKGFMDSVYGKYAFTDGSTINDMIYLAVSPVSYYGVDVSVLMQITGIFSGSDYSIWDAIYRYRSAPFHEVWVTTGGRFIQLFDKDDNADSRLYGYYRLHDEKEYIVFRPTPYDHPAIIDSEIDDIEGKVIALDTIRDLSLNSVKATFSGATIARESIINSDLYSSDENLYSVYKVTASGPKITSGVADVVWPPILDKQALRQVGKRVFMSVLEGLDMSSAIKKKAGAKVSTLIKYFRVLQAKAYNWFKYNGRFTKGSLHIQWIPQIYEGEHIRLAPGYGDEYGLYYLNTYTLQMTHNSLTYTLDVTRGFPEEGFAKAATDYKEKTKEKKPKVSEPKIIKKNIPDIPTVGGGGGEKPSGKGPDETEIGEDKEYSYSGEDGLKINSSTGDIFDEKTGEKVGNAYLKSAKGSTASSSSAGGGTEGEPLSNGKKLATVRRSQYKLNMPQRDYACLYMCWYIETSFMTSLGKTPEQFAELCIQQKAMRSDFFVNSPEKILIAADLSQYVTSVMQANAPAAMQKVKDSIDADIPVIASLGGGHYQLISGYDTVDGELFFLVDDPGLAVDTHVETTTMRVFKFGANKLRIYSKNKKGEQRKVTSFRFTVEA